MRDSVSLSVQINLNGARILRAAADAIEGSLGDDRPKEAPVSMGQGEPKSEKETFVTMAPKPNPEKKRGRKPKVSESSITVKTEEPDLDIEEFKVPRTQASEPDVLAFEEDSEPEYTFPETPAEPEVRQVKGAVALPVDDEDLDSFLNERSENNLPPQKTGETPRDLPSRKPLKSPPQKPKEVETPQHAELRVAFARLARVKNTTACKAILSRYSEQCIINHVPLDKIPLVLKKIEAEINA